MATAARRCPRVLTFLDYYLPGIKAGGPVTTIRNLVARLGGELDFRIVTRDRDLGDTTAYRGVRLGAWNRIEGADVFYVPQRQTLISLLMRQLRDERFDLMYVNSLFSPRFSLGPLLVRRLGLVGRRPVVVAPRGELAAGALGLRPWKKRPCLALAKRFGLHEGVTWQASSEFEAEDIRREFGRGAQIVIAPNLVAPQAAVGSPPSRPPKRPGTLSIAFLARISRTKNLLTVLSLLGGLGGQISLSIYGPTEDAAYWRACCRAIEELPPNVRADYRGVVPPERVMETLSGHDLFLLPTLGENFGHVIFESLRAGCPVLISDRTPWRDLERHRAGWEFPLESVAQFRTALEHVLRMEEGEHRRWRAGARELAARVQEDDAAVEQNRRLLETALRQPMGAHRLAAAG